MPKNENQSFVDWGGAKPLAKELFFGKRDKASMALAWAAKKQGKHPFEGGGTSPSAAKQSMKKEAKAAYESSKAKAEGASKRASAKKTAQAHEDARASHENAGKMAKQASELGAKVDVGAHVAAAKAHAAERDKSGGAWDESKHPRDETGKFG